MAKQSDKPTPITADTPIAGQPLIAVLQQIVSKLDGLSTQVEHLDRRVEHLEREQEKTNITVETYQKASGQVVNLAFGLLATATITVILSTIFSK